MGQVSDITKKDTSTRELTRKELMILNLFAQGYNGKQIAETLVLSYATIKWYSKHIRSKLNVHTMAHAVYIGIKEGFIE